MINRTSWITPASKIIVEDGSDFNANIDKTLFDLKNNESLKRFYTKNKNEAIVMSIAHYEKIIEMKNILGTIIEALHKEDVYSSDTEFDALFEKLTSGNTSAAANHLLNVSDVDLAKTILRS